MNHSELVSAAFAAFSPDVTARPSISLRAGNALDEYRVPPDFDPLLDVTSDAYLEGNHWGVVFLDAASWRHYLPHLIEYSLRHLQQGNDVTDALLSSLRPPDREPARLASLSPEQESVVTRFLDVLAFSEESAHRELACLALEEWWAPGALYRRRER